MTGSMIPRRRQRHTILDLLRQHPVVALLGARQVGKTTLALEILKERATAGERFDLEDPADLARLADPMLAHYHGQVWNASEFGRSLGATDKTVRHYLDILSTTQVVQVLPPWYTNIRKRQVKSPKVYVRDPGILHGLLDIRDRRDLERHPKVGASWEGFLLRQVAERLGATADECFFWATHSGVELDLLWVRGRRRWGFEFKRTSSPALTRSLMTAMDTLELQKAFLVHAGDKTFPLHRKVTAVSAAGILDDLRPVP